MPFDVYYGGPGNYPWIPGAILTFFFWAAVVVVFVMVARHFGHTHPSPTSEATAIDTLKMRFARGEIDAEEFQRHVELLKSTK
jgi:putative membrane protein